MVALVRSIAPLSAADALCSATDRGDALDVHTASATGRADAVGVHADQMGPRVGLQWRSVRLRCSSKLIERDQRHIIARTMDL
jgi:hypothetical protein